MATFGIEAKIVVRKKYYVVYIKEGSQIVEILSVMEAHCSSDGAGEHPDSEGDAETV